VVDGRLVRELGDRPVPRQAGVPAGRPHRLGVRTHAGARPGPGPRPRGRAGAEVPGQALDVDQVGIAALERPGHR
jgi:hypothetical protein